MAQAMHEWASEPSVSDIQTKPDATQDLEPGAIVELEMTRMEMDVTPQDLALIQVFERLDRFHRDMLDGREREFAVRDDLYRDLIGGRDREIRAKDRLIAELEHRVERSERQGKVLEEYIQHLPPDDPPASDKEAEGQPLQGRRRRFGWFRR